MSAITIIRTTSDLAHFTTAVSGLGWVALDTEFLRERTYAPELCLIQAASDDGAVCIDPLAMADLSPLNEMLADPQVTKVFHACRQDLEALDTRFSVRVENLYDTQLAAAFCGYGEQVGYAALVEAVCGVHLPKAHTRADWSRRPLPQAQLEYALDDVRYLAPLWQELARALRESGREDWHREECIAAVDPELYQFNPHNVRLHLKGGGRMDAAGRVCMENLVAWREQKAHDRNLPRNWILATSALHQICRTRPRTPVELAQIDGINARAAEKNGPEILAIVAQSKQQSDRAPRAAPLKMLTPEQQQRVKKILAFLTTCAEQSQISRSLLANRQDIENFVRGQTDIPLFTGWRAQLAGKEIQARYSE